MGKGKAENKKGMYMMSSNDLRKQVLSIKILILLSRLFKNNNNRIPSWAIMLFTESIAIALHSIVWLYIFPNLTSKSTIFLWAYWGALIAGIIVVLVERNLDFFLKTVGDLTPLLDPKNKGFDEWKKTVFAINKQVFFSIVFAIAIFPMTYIFFSQTIGVVTINYGAIILFVNLILIGNGFYWLLFLPGATRAIIISMRKLSLFDPKNTYWTQQLSRIYSQAAISASVIGVMIIFPIAFGPQTKNVNTIAIVWLILVWALVLIPYIIAQASITEFISKERLETLTEIQMQIFKIVNKPPTEKGEKRLENLISIYNKSIEAKSSVWDINPQIVNSLILPLASFLLINFDKIRAFIQTLIK